MTFLTVVKTILIGIGVIIGVILALELIESILRWIRGCAKEKEEKAKMFKEIGILVNNINAADLKKQIVPLRKEKKSNDD